VSTSAILPLALLENSLASLTSSSSIQSIQTNQPTISNGSTVNAASKINNDTSGDSQDTLTHDTVTLLKDLAKGNLTAADEDLDQLKTDLKNQSASTTSTKINQDVIALLKDLNAGNNSSVNTDVTNLKTDLQTQDQSTASTKTTSSQNVSPLAALLSKITDQLNSGSVQGALQDLAGYLIQNGHVTGSLLNVMA
jgi:hypothetical protein